MKFIFKIILTIICTTQTSTGAKLIISYEKSRIKESIHVKEYFISKYLIPENLIRMTALEKCKSLDKRFLEVCINKKGELIEFSNINKDKILKSLRTFTLGGQND